jgi:hypothetical protein
MPFATSHNVAAGAAKARAFIYELAVGAISLVRDIPIPSKITPENNENMANCMNPTIAASNKPVVTPELNSSVGIKRKREAGI